MGSIETLLGTKANPRLRGGVGRPAESVATAEHVLDKFTSDERPVVDRMVVAAVEAVEIWRQKGWKAALPLGNRKVEA